MSEGGAYKSQFKWVVRFVILCVNRTVSINELFSPRPIVFALKKQNVDWTCPIHTNDGKPHLSIIQIIRNGRYSSQIPFCNICKSPSNFSSNPFLFKTHVQLSQGLDTSLKTHGPLQTKKLDILVSSTEFVVSR